MTTPGEPPPTDPILIRALITAARTMSGLPIDPAYEEHRKVLVDAIAAYDEATSVEE